MTTKSPQGCGSGTGRLTLIYLAALSQWLSGPPGEHVGVPGSHLALADMLCVGALAMPCWACGQVDASQEAAGRYWVKTLMAVCTRVWCGV